MTLRRSIGLRTPAIARAFCVLAALMAAPAAAADIVAYRGGGGLYPEGTREAFANSLGVGVDALHVAVAATSDDVPVAIHGLNLDGDLTRDAQGRWLAGYEPAVRIFTFRELQDYDVGRPDADSRIWERNPNFVPIDGLSPPSLAEVAGLMRRARNKTARFYVEALGSPFRRDLTPPPADYGLMLARTIKAARLIDRALLMARDWTILRVAETHEPDLRTGCITVETRWLNTVRRGEDGPSPWLGGIDVDDFPSLPDAVKASGCAVWAPHAGGVNAGEIEQAQAIGLGVALWPIDAPGAMTHWMDQGVDAILTGRPDLLRSLVIERGDAPPPRTRVR